MCFGKIFLAIAWIVSFEATCSVCCDYNPGCVGWTSQANCTGYCVWTGSACRYPICSDNTSPSDCESAGCIYDGSPATCREATSCNEFPQIYCDWMSVNGKQCAWIGAVCKVPSCADFQSSGQAFCEDDHSGDNFYDFCKYNTATSTCTLSTSCSDWNGNSDCDYKSFSDQCSTLGSVCKVLACEDFASTQTVCETHHSGIYGNCKFNSGTCTLATCSSWTANGQSTCESKFDSSSGNSCIFDTTNNVCRAPICEDNSIYNCYPYRGCAVSSSNLCTTASSCSAWDGSSYNCSSGRIGDDECIYQNTDAKCVLKPSCASLTSQTDCEDNYCNYVDVCPQEAPPSHAIFMRVSSLLVVLLLAFLL